MTGMQTKILPKFIKHIPKTGYANVFYNPKLGDIKYIENPLTNPPKNSSGL